MTYIDIMDGGIVGTALFHCDQPATECTAEALFTIGQQFQAGMEWQIRILIARKRIINEWIIKTNDFLLLDWGGKPVHQSPTHLKGTRSKDN